MLLGEIARRNSRRYPTKTAVIHDGTDITWAQLDDRANRLGNYLLGCGLRPGDAVAIAAQNTLQWPEIAYGLAKSGLVLVPLNIRLTAAEVSYIVADAGCRAARGIGAASKPCAAPSAPPPNSASNTSPSSPSAPKTGCGRLAKCAS